MAAQSFEAVRPQQAGFGEVRLTAARPRGADVLLTFSDGRPDLELSLFWLRDHCPSAQAQHPETHQRLADTLQIPADVAADSIAIEGEGRLLCVRWRHDGHESRYEAAFLAGLRPDPEVLPVVRELWDGEQIRAHRPEVSWGSFMQSDAALLEALEQLERFGLCWIESVPATPEATQAFAERIAYIRLTIFGGYYDFTANLEHKDTAYTSLAIGPHTDGTYSFDAPGYQIFHCLAAECTGGENVLIDGFKVAAVMRAEHPDDYEVLTRVKIPGQYLDHSRGIQLMARRPLFRLDDAGTLVQVSYNNHDRAPFVLPPAEHRSFYRALTRFARLCGEPALQYRRRLLPGTVLIFDNWRLLHARDAYVGYRRLAGAYLNKEDVESRLRVLRIRSGQET
jgi:trimethyllysine dioxygenase